MRLQLLKVRFILRFASLSNALASNRPDDASSAQRDTKRSANQAGQQTLPTRLQLLQVELVLLGFALQRLGQRALPLQQRLQPRK